MRELLAFCLVVCLVALLMFAGGIATSGLCKTMWGPEVRGEEGRDPATAPSMSGP